ncbi:MAG TPA: nucleotidyltransferase family protein [Devosia sp.]|nr:nucleotidyltransferase family protein [Devosia sp.]
MADTIAIIVLAAGLSTRFGAGNKLLADLRGRPLADHIASTIAPLPFAAKFAVCPADLPELGTLFAQRGFSVLSNPDNAAGQSTSLRLGVEAADKIGADAVLICLADMPFVTSEHLLTLADRLKDGSTHTASAIENGPSMPPAIFARHHFPALLQTSGDRGARDLLRSANQLIVPARQLADYDTLEDFASSA